MHCCRNSLSHLIAHKLLHKSHHRKRQRQTHTHTHCNTCRFVSSARGRKAGGKAEEWGNNISGFHFSTICRVCPLGAQMSAASPFFGQVPSGISASPLASTALPLPLPFSLVLSPSCCLSRCYSSLCATCRSCCRLAAFVCLAVFSLAMKRKCNPLPAPRTPTAPSNPTATWLPLWDRLPSHSWML